MSTERPISSELPAPAKLTFVFYFHAERHYPPNDPLFILLEDHDLILTETVGLSTETRKDLETELNLVLHAQENLTPDQAQTRTTLINHFQNSLDTDEQIALRFAGTGKTIIFIDASNEDTKSINLYRKGTMLQKSINLALLSGDVAQAQANLALYAQTLVEEISFRNGLVARQIYDLSEAGACSGRGIAILQGYLHSQTSNLLQTLLPQSQPQVHFLVPALTPETKLVEDLSLGRPISESDYRRTLLSDYILLPILSVKEETNDELALLINLCSLANNMTDEQVKSALNQYSIVYRQNLTHLLGRKRHHSPKEREAYAAFAYAQTANYILQMVKQLVKKQSVPGEI